MLTTRSAFAFLALAAPLFFASARAGGDGKDNLGLSLSGSSFGLSASYGL